jgi:hypothetical protein
MQVKGEMKMFQRKSCLKSALIASLLMTSVGAIAVPQPFVGTVSESMCGAKHMMAGKTDAECTHVCIKANSKYALVVEKKVYILSGPEADFSKLAGKRVRVTGDNNGDTITVKSIAVAAN